MTSVAATWVLLGVVGIGLLAGLVAAFGSRRATPVAAGSGWIGLVGGAVSLYAGGAGFDPAPVAAAFAMAASGALVVLPAVGSGTELRAAGGTAAVVIGGVVWYGGMAVALGGGATPWDGGAVLIGVHWAALGAAAASALTGALLVLYWGFRSWRSSPEEDDGDAVSPREIRARARDAAARAVALLWLAWPVARLIHWRYLGAPGIGSRSEWFAMGITLLATGGLLVGWDLAESRNAKLRSAIGPVLVAAATIAGIWVSFGFGSPFALSLGS